MTNNLTLLLTPNQKIITFLQTLAKVGSLLVIIIALICMLAWHFTIALSTSFFPHVVGMSPLAAVGFISAASSLLLQLTNSIDKKKLWKSVGTRILSIFTLILGILTSISLFHSPFSLNQLIFTNILLGDSISLDISISFILVGIALLLLTIPAEKHFIRLAQGMTLIAALLSMFAVIGYLYQSLSFYKLFPVTPMPLSSALTFSILCISLLLAKPNKGFVKALTRDTSSSVLALRLTFIALTLPAILGYIILQGEAIHMYDAQSGLTLLVIGSISLFSIAVWINSSALQKLELENLLIKNELEKKNVTLEVDAKSLATKLLAIEEEKEEAYDKLSIEGKLQDITENSI